MILLGKIVSVNKIYINESYWLYTLQRYTIKINHSFVKISLNLMDFTDLFYKEILTSVILFSSRNTFSLNQTFFSL